VIRARAVPAPALKMATAGTKPPPNSAHRRCRLVPHGFLTVYHVEAERRADCAASRANTGCTVRREPPRPPTLDGDGKGSPAQVFVRRESSNGAASQGAERARDNRAHNGRAKPANEP
jgi:hypothetical protein